MSLSFSPILPWPLLVILGSAALGLSIWAYATRFRGTSGRWRVVAVALRAVAVLLCLFAALRPSIMTAEKIKQPATLAFLVDKSSSMGITDEVPGISRAEAARRTLADARKALEGRDPDLDVKFYSFGAELKEFDPDADPVPDDEHQTAIGSPLVDLLKRQSGSRLVGVVLLSDGNSNAGLPPIDAAERLRSQQVPITAVAFGHATAGAGSRDLAVRELVVPSTVYNKNLMPVRGTIRARGFANEPIEAELLVERLLVANKTITAPDGQEMITVTGLNYTPEVPGEKRVTLRVKPKEGELVRSNNEYTTYVTVLSGGINVLFLQGPAFTWEYNFLTRALDASPEIQVDLKVLKAPVRGDKGELDDADLAGKYDAYILGDLPADRLTRAQHDMLKQAVEKGAGLIALGGRDSFGAGGWAASPIADLLPVTIHPGDGQIEPGENGLKIVPRPGGTDDYLMRIGPTAAESAALWDRLPAINGANRFGPPKRIARVLADTPSGDPLLVAMDLGKGRVIAFGGETWPWARAAVVQADEAVAQAHKRFWRQVILWLTHKEDDDQSQVKLALSRRRVPLGDKLDLTARALDAKGRPIADAAFEVSVSALDDAAAPAQKVDMLNQGDDARGSFFATKSPGEYRATVTAKQGETTLGTASARFIVYLDDIELNNPAADPSLLRQIAEMTGGKLVPAENLAEYLKSLDLSALTDYQVQTEHRLWDNWPFLLAFAAVLSVEWWLRKRYGWV